MNWFKGYFPAFYHFHNIWCCIYPPLWRHRSCMNQNLLPCGIDLVSKGQERVIVVAPCEMRQIGRWGRNIKDNEDDLKRRIKVWSWQTWQAAVCFLPYDTSLLKECYPFGYNRFRNRYCNQRINLKAVTKGSSCSFCFPSQFPVIWLKLVWPFDRVL